MEPLAKPTADAPARPRPVSVFFAPKAIAVIGASETAGSVGRTVLWNLLAGFALLGPRGEQVQHAIVWPFRGVLSQIGLGPDAEPAQE